jgi:hypothetical protein
MPLWQQLLYGLAACAGTVAVLVGIGLAAEWRALRTGKG